MSNVKIKLPKAEKIKRFKDFFNSSGKLLTATNGNKLGLSLDEYVQSTKDWKGTTLDVDVLTKKGVKKAYFVKSRKTWYIVGYKSFDVELFQHKDILLSPKFVPNWSFRQFKKTLMS